MREGWREGMSNAFFVAVETGTPLPKIAISHEAVSSDSCACVC